MSEPQPLPDRLETERLYLRPYRAGDGSWYCATGQRNRDHLWRYESENAILSVNSPDEAEGLVRELAADWQARTCFFLGAFDRSSGEFVAQIYIGPAGHDPHEFEIGYFADIDHQGHGYVTEAVQAALRFAFEHLGAHRVCLHCDETNVRSRRVAERCGFRLEEHLHEGKLNPDGSPSVTLRFGLAEPPAGCGGWHRLDPDQGPVTGL